MKKFNKFLAGQIGLDGKSTSMQKGNEPVNHKDDNTDKYEELTKILSDLNLGLTIPEYS
jgi:hypothetical protein